MYPPSTFTQWARATSQPRIKQTPGPPTGAAFKVPGEEINLHTGTVWQEVVDYRYPGTNGMDILLGRSYNKTSLEQDDIAFHWSMEFPRLLTSQTSCTPGYAGTAPPGITNSFQLVLPGASPMDFYVNYQFPSTTGAQFISLDKWTAFCTGSRNQDFLVKSPEGKSYYEYKANKAYIGPFPEVSHPLLGMISAS